MHWIEKRNEKGGAKGKVGEYLPNKEEGEEEQQRWGWCHWGNKGQRERESGWHGNKKGGEVRCGVVWECGTQGPLSFQAMWGIQQYTKISLAT